MDFHSLGPAMGCSNNSQFPCTAGQENVMFPFVTPVERGRMPGCIMPRGGCGWSALAVNANARTAGKMYLRIMLGLRWESGFVELRHVIAVAVILQSRDEIAGVDHPLHR